MPDPILTELPEDPGMEVTEDPRPAKTAKVSVNSREVIEKAFAALGLITPGQPETAVGGAHAPVVPSARARAAIETLVHTGSAAALQTNNVDLKAIAKDLFDWQTPNEPTRATGNVVKAMGAALLAVGDDGASRYAQAVEMLSFAAAAAPLLQPDRLMRLIAAAPTVSTAFAPERYTVQLASALRTIVSRYQEQRREQLLISLWQVAHTGRWWDVTSGVIKVVDGTGHVRKDAEARAAATAVVNELLANAQAGTAQASDQIADALSQAGVPFNEATAEVFVSLPPTAKLRDAVARIVRAMHHGDPVDPDSILLLSYLSWLNPAERPETPITWLAKNLVRALVPDLEGSVLLDALPAKPKDWPSLYPPAELAGFPYPAPVRALEGQILPGTGNDAVAETRICLVKNAAELAANRDYMGNCTWSYKERLESGHTILFALWLDGSCINAAFNRGNGGWQLGDINGRHNRGGVPDGVRQAMAALAAQVPVPELPAGERRDKRLVRYAVR